MSRRQPARSRIGRRATPSRANPLARPSGARPGCRRRTAARSGPGRARRAAPRRGATSQPPAAGPRGGPVADLGQPARCGSESRAAPSNSPVPASVAASSAARPLAGLAVVSCSTKAAVAHLLVRQERPGPAVAPQPPLQHRPAGDALDGEPGPLGGRPRPQSPGEARQVTRSSPSAPSGQRQAAATDSEADPPPRACPAVQEPTSGPATPAQPLRAGHHVSRPAPLQDAPAPCAQPAGDTSDAHCRASMRV